MMTKFGPALRSIHSAIPGSIVNVDLNFRLVEVINIFY